MCMNASSRCSCVVTWTLAFDGLLFSTSRMVLIVTGDVMHQGAVSMVTESVVMCLTEIIAIITWF